MNRLKKGDTVKVITGNYKGERGRVIKMYFNNNRALVEGLNKVKKHTRPTQDNPQGGIVEKEMSIHTSNLMLIYKNKPVKVGFELDKKNKKNRINKKNGDTVG